MKQASRSRRPKTPYKVKNWPEYNQALVNRGNITLWISPEYEAQWYYQGPTQQGGQFKYSDLVIEAALTVRQLLRLPFRQTKGFVTSLVKLMRMQVDTPSYSQLCRRMKNLKINFRGKSANEITDIALDGSGMKVYGEGEWKVRQHGVGKRRTWRKLHIGLDPDSKQVMLMEVTTNSVHDSEAAQEMLERNDLAGIRRAYGDGAYDTWQLHYMLEEMGIEAIIPPRKGSKIAVHGNRKGKPLPRDEIIRSIRKHGLKNWKRQSGYHRRSLVENFFFRYKTTFGDRFKSRSMKNQTVEATINIRILNKMFSLGAPKSYKVEFAV